MRSSVSPGSAAIRRPWKSLLCAQVRAKVVIMTTAGDVIRARRESLGLTRRDVAATTGVSESAVKMLEDGGRKERGEWRTVNPSPRTLSGVDKALRWAAGSAARVVDGGEPVELPDADGSDAIPQSDFDRLASLAERQMQLAEESAALLRELTRVLNERSPS